jgi:hypothetical protein
VTNRQRTLRTFSATVSATFAAALVSLAAFAAPARAADPTTADCLAASDASLKSGNEHKLRAERAQLLVCAAPSCPADIRKECTARVDEVNAQIPTIIFEAKDGAGNDLSAVRVTMDGEVLAERLEGTALSIDPGRHAFTFETAGQRPVTKEYVMLQAQKDRRETVTFGSPPPALAAAPAAHGGLGTQRIAAIAATGAGVVGLGIGTVFGVMAMSKKSDAQSACPDRCADQAGVALWSDAKSAGNVSTIAFVIGGLGVAAGAALWLTAGSDAAPQVGVGPASVTVRGRW